MKKETGILVISAVIAVGMMKRMQLQDGSVRFKSRGNKDVSVSQKIRTGNYENMNLKMEPIRQNSIPTTECFM